MKWYFACNDRSEDFYPLIKGAVNSAIENTTLEPNFIYDGEENDLTEWLRKKGVNIIHYRSSFFDELEKYYNGKKLDIASGAFLRCDIPIIEKDDDYILYTDCDILFLKDFDINKIQKPEYFSCSTQFEKDDFICFNTGVMVMNIKKLRESHEKFVKFIVNNFKRLNTYDQDAYQIFYNGKNTKLSIEYNHKPYWEINDNAIILHFHGPKPTTFADEEQLKTMFSDYYTIYKKNPEVFKYYLKIFNKYNPEVIYNEEAIEKLDKGIYPLKICSKRSIFTRIKLKLQKCILKKICKKCK